MVNTLNNLYQNTLDVLTREIEEIKHKNEDIIHDKKNELVEAIKLEGVNICDKFDRIVSFHEKLRVNVVLVTYNHEKYIEECLKSIIMQETDFLFNIIVADDLYNHRIDWCDGSNELWKKVACDYAEGLDAVQFVELDCGHYVHHFEYERISKRISKDMKEL